MKAAKVVGRVTATTKDKTVKGKKILLLKPLSWREVADIFKNSRKDKTPESKKSIIALDAVGAGASEYVFYVSSKEACQAFSDDAICNHAVIGILDGVNIEL
ncbi:MAG: EutN/CcmL family microcompartment protein [Elusimicrobia bacterium]|jgi:microcompartment protein CcmK/EutM|nr:EutN/CcmL family microcompartment protein [Elusimicrobiota bacterium]